MRNKTLAYLLVLLVAVAAIPQAALAGDYVDDMLMAHKRGFTNILTGVVEIPMAAQEAHGEGIVGINYVQGLIVGTGRAVARILSGAWDVPAGFIPGLQQGMPPDPETLF